MEKMRARLYDGMAARGVTGPVADQVFEALAAFANFGFPESHSVSFAHLVYSSAWLKLHYPAAFTAGLLNSQPMGFWSPQSLVADARRHGVRVRRPHVNHSEVGASLEAGAPGEAVLRLGLGSVRGVGEATAERIVAGRPWRGGEDLVRRAGVTQAQLETLAAAGALDPEGPEHVDGDGEVRGRRPAGAACCGRRGRRRRGRPTACPGSWWGPRPRRCPSPASTTGWATTCGRSGWRRSARPCISPASGSRRWA